MNTFKKFLKEEDALGTVEIVIILAVLVSIALIFRKTIIKYVQDLLESILQNSTDGGKIESSGVEVN